MIKRFLLALILFLSFSGIVFSFSSCTHVQKAAEQGDADAQYDLATMYHNGEGVPQNYTEAMKWYKKAAEQGYVDAQYDLALMYLKGEGVSQDYIEGYVWASIASAKGKKDAKQYLTVIESEMTLEQLAEAQKKAAAVWDKIIKSKKN